MNRELRIDVQPVGPDHSTCVVCEISANHQASLPRMLEIIEAVVRTGCDAIKIQSYTSDTMTIDSERPEYRIEGGLWDGRMLYDLYR
jgi:N-acetylneuraminate synthase